MPVSPEYLRSLTPDESQELTELQRELGQVQMKPAGMTDADWQEHRTRLDLRLSEILRTAEQRAASSRFRSGSIQRGNTLITVTLLLQLILEVL